MFMDKKAVLFFVILFASQCFAQSAVIIEPIDGEGVLSLYPLEVKDYKLTVVNISDSDLKNVQVVISVPPELSVVVNGEDRQEAYYSFLSLSANAREERVFKIKAKEITLNPVEIKAEHGVENLSNSSTILINVEKSSFSFTSRLNQTSLEPGQESSVFFDISNNSDLQIKNIVAELFSKDDVLIKTPAFNLSNIEAGQTISNTEFIFSLGKGTGKKVLGLRVSFEDSKGKHILEKAFLIDVQNRDIYVLLLAFAIVVLVGVSFYMRKNKVPQKVETQGIEVKELD